LIGELATFEGDDFFKIRQEDGDALDFVGDED
jgi:hypothetical protein